MDFTMVKHLLVSGLTPTGSYIIRVSERISPNGAAYLTGGCSPPVSK